MPLSNKKARQYCSGRPFYFASKKSDKRPPPVGGQMMMMAHGSGDSSHETNTIADAVIPVPLRETSAVRRAQSAGSRDHQASRTQEQSGALPRWKWDRH